MQNWPLLVHKILDHAAVNNGRREIVTKMPDSQTHRTNWSKVNTRARKVASALESRGIKLGDRVGTLALNSYRHMEVWYGATGTGAIYHTLNPRLFPEQISQIVNHAEDRCLFFDPHLADLVAEIAPLLTSVEFFVAFTDRQNLPNSNIPNLIAYEDFIAGGDPDFVWGTFDENTAAGLCYTSGTTGAPKGVLYSHRSTVLHALIALGADMHALRSVDCALSVVQMYHANAWALSFTTPISGAKLVMPTLRVDGEAIYDLLESEQVTFTAAVPTVWLSLLQYLEEHPEKRFTSLERVMIGGAACPQYMIETFEKKYGVKVLHAWGMTEMSPLGSVGTLTADVAQLPPEAQMPYKLKQGHAFFGVEMKLVDEENQPLPRDGKSMGRLKVRGPAVVRGYFKGAGVDAFDAEGWFDTGDISTIDPFGYMQITDRSKDVIKSGGEWISSIELENVALGHPSVAEAAVIGIAHPKWDERPLLIVALKPGRTATRDDILDYLHGKIAKWWIPDDVVFVDEIPHTATGKIQKAELREKFRR